MKGGLNNTPISGSLALGAQHGKLDADLRTSALLGTPSVQSIHDYYSFAMEDGGRLAPMAAELVDRLAILVAVIRRFQEGSADAVACLPVPRAWVFPSFLLFAWWPPLLFLVRIFLLIIPPFAKMEAKKSA
jgi:hypothetical protein